ncbi:XtrA/YqaO family protein [Brevibacillus sp. NPDC058079]|uniref:XtrA/YqaO family protein n=1 Tax=Brevibacillus sp. NPDC058079 TaxID=3346330 RepID=UPI0036DFE5E6
MNNWTGGTEDEHTSKRSKDRHRKYDNHSSGGENSSNILVDPKQGKAKIVPLVEHGETVVKSSQGKISKVDYRESELF